MLDCLIRKVNDKTKSEDGFTVLEFVMAFAVIAVLFGAGVYGYPKMQEWRTQSEMNVVTEWGYQSGLNVMMNPWSGLTIEEALEKSKDGHPEVVLTYEGNTRTDFCVTGTRVGDTEGKYTTQSGACGQNDGEPLPEGPGGPVIQDTITKMTYQCDSTTTGPFSLMQLEDGATALVESSTGSDVLLNVATEGLYGYYKTFDPITLNAGVEYHVTVDGKFQMMSNLGLGQCLTKVEKIGDDTGLHTINAFAGNKLVAVPDSIPSTVTSLSHAFQGANNFNDPNISSWDVSRVTDFTQTFIGVDAFNQPLNEWDVSSGITFNHMFSQATLFNQPLNTWDMSQAADLTAMFQHASDFNQPLDSWDISNVSNITNLFWNASAFNQNINSWDVSNVTNFAGTFFGASSFNQPLNNWDTSSALTMEGMFQGATSFNQNLNNFDTSKLTSMNSMFFNAVAFNNGEAAGSSSAPLTWNTSNVRTFNSTFRLASSFNQNLTSWNVSNATSRENFNDGSGLSPTNLPVW